MLWRWRKHYWLVACLLTLALMSAQALESQHHHGQYTTDCYLCQQSATLACDTDPQPQLAPAEQGSWQETSPYFRHLRQLHKRGKRDPPQSPTVSV